jgi:hypothetical protein
LELVKSFTGQKIHDKSAINVRQGFMSSFKSLSHASKVEAISLLRRLSSEDNNGAKNDLLRTAQNALEKFPPRAWAMKDQVAMVEIFEESLSEKVSGSRRLLGRRRKLLWGKVGKAVKSGATFLKEKVEGAIDYSKPHVETALEKGNQAAEKVGDVANNAAGAIGDTAKGAVKGGAKMAAETAVDATIWTTKMAGKKVAKEAASAVKGAGSYAKDQAVKGFGAAKTQINKGLDAAKPHVDAAKAAMRPHVEAAKGAAMGAVAYVVPKMKSAAEWLHDNALRPTGEFLREYVVGPAANYINNMVQFFQGLVTFNPRKSIAEVIKHAICGRSGVPHAIAWGTSSKKLATLESIGILNGAIANAVTKIQDSIAVSFNDPNFALKLETVLGHFKKLAPSQLRETTLAATAEKFAAGMHCGASFHGIWSNSTPANYAKSGIYGPGGIFASMWTPNILADITSLSRETLNKNALMLGVKEFIGSCGATAFVDKAYPWIMNDLTKLDECVAPLIEPWLNEDATNGIIETRSCGNSEAFGRLKAHVSLDSYPEVSQELNMTKMRETMLLDLSPDETEVVSGRCVSAGNDEEKDAACKHFTTRATCERETNEEILHVVCRWADNGAMMSISGGLSHTSFPPVVPSLRAEAERNVAVEHIVEKRLNASCDTLSLDYTKQIQLGGYDPLVLADEGFLPIPSAARYISACNYLNTMGIGGNQPQNGCAPKCWMAFRIQALRKRHGGLPLPPLEDETPAAFNQSTGDIVEDVAVEDEVLENETTVPDMRCVKLQDPYTSAEYVGAVLDDEFQGEGLKVSAGVTQLASFLPMISLHPDIPSKARASLKACIPSLRKPLRDFMMPRCTEHCQVAYPCTSWCHAVRDECFHNNDTQSVILDIIQGDGSRIGTVTKSMIGADNFKIVATLLRKLLHCQSKPSNHGNATGDDASGSFSLDSRRCLDADTPAPQAICSPPVLKPSWRLGSNVSKSQHEGSSILRASREENADGDHDDELSIQEKEEEEVDEELMREEESDVTKTAAKRATAFTGPTGEENEEESALKQLLEDSADEVTGATGSALKKSRVSNVERHRQVVKQWHPAWQNDTVIDHDSGIAMRMIDGQVEDLQ